MNNINTKQYKTIDTLATRKAFFEQAKGPSLHETIKEIMEMSDGMSVLDVGCGYGKDLILFDKKYKNFSGMGIDQSAGQINQAQKNQSGNLNFRVASAEKFKFTTKFDRIIMRHVLHLVDRKRIALQNAYNHLTPGGKIIIILHSDETQPKLDEWINWFKDLYKVRYAAARKNLTIERDNTLFENFEKIERKKVTVNITLKDPKTYIDYLQTLKSRFRPKLVDYQWQSFIDYTEYCMRSEIKKYGKFEETSTNGIIIITK